MRAISQTFTPRDVFNVIVAYAAGCVIGNGIVLHSSKLIWSGSIVLILLLASTKFQWFKNMLNDKKAAKAAMQASTKQHQVNIQNAADTLALSALRDTARSWSFDLSEPPDYSDTTVEFVPLQLVPLGVTLDHPIKVEIPRYNLFRDFVATDSPLQVTFPEATVEADGTIEDYGQVAVLHGATDPSLPIYRDEFQKSAEAPFLWQIPRSLRSEQLN